MSEYRKRPPRLNEVFSHYYAPVYFVTMVTWNRRPLLASTLVHDAFRQYAIQLSSNRVAVGRYVLMPDHVHLFIRIGYGRKLNESIKHLKQAITKKLRENDPGMKVWQPGFFDHLLRTHESYAGKWSYVVENPVRKGLTGSAREWSYQGEIVKIQSTQPL